MSRLSLLTLAVAYKQETYSAVAIGTKRSVGGKSICFDFRMNRYATDEEVEKALHE